jgi:hypothetical protein
MAESNTASADARTMPATRASSSTGKYDQSGPWCSTIRKITMTMVWNTKNTQAEPTAARERISLGNETFLTMPALFTTTPVPVRTPSEKRFHRSRPANRKMTKSGMWFPRMIWKTKK